MGQRFAFLAVLIAAIAGLASGGIVHAQESTPSAASACAAEPRSADELIAIWYGANGTPVAVPADEAKPDPSVLAAASVADADAAAAIRETTDGFLACGNAGDFARELSFVTDDLALTFGPGPGMAEADARAALAATPRAVPDDQAVTLVSIENPVVMPDGRIVARVTVNYPAGLPSSQTSLLFFKEVDGVWLVDGFYDIAATPDTPATPLA